jgi:hypothetical protein
VQVCLATREPMGILGYHPLPGRLPSIIFKHRSA